MEPATPTGSRYYSSESPNSRLAFKGEDKCFPKCGPWTRISFHEDQDICATGDFAAYKWCTELQLVRPNLMSIEHCFLHCYF